MSRSLTAACLAAGLVVLGGVSTAAGAAAGDAEPVPANRVQAAQISGDPDMPRRHFRVRRPAHLDPAEAEAVYRELLGEMLAGYRQGGHAVAEAYDGWSRYNSGPYLSRTHGNLYINHYANETAKAYAQMWLLSSACKAFDRLEDSQAVIPTVIMLRLFQVLEKAGFSSTSRVFVPGEALKALEQIKSLIDIPQIEIEPDTPTGDDRDDPGPDDQA